MFSQKAEVLSEALSVAQHGYIEVSLKRQEFSIYLHLKRIIIFLTSLSARHLKTVHQFCCLRCTILLAVKINEEIDKGMANINSTFSGLYKQVWMSKHLKKSRSVNVNRAIILTTFLYGSESWVAYHHLPQLLKHFHQSSLHTILNINWNDFVTNTEILKQAEVTSIKAMSLKIQLSLAGHASIMEDHHQTKTVLYRGAL